MEALHRSTLSLPMPIPRALFESLGSGLGAHPALLVASPARLSRSRHRRRRASAEPRASRRADRAPPTSSCERRSRRRHTRAPFRARRVSSDITALSFCCSLVAAPARFISELAPTTPSERRAASESSCRPSAADLAVRAPVVPSTHVRATVCAAVRRVTSPRSASAALLVTAPAP